jgi:homoserine O-acetyltransferase
MRFIQRGFLPAPWATALLFVAAATPSIALAATPPVGPASTAPAGAAAATPSPAASTRWPVREGSYTIRDFRFGTGEVLPELRLTYLTLGTRRVDAQGRTTNAVLLLHGTGGDRRSLLNPLFADQLFGPGQPLDLAKHFLILPDDIGHGDASKPSDGLRARFPRYDYDDMVRSQHRMLVDGLQVDRLRLILGTSMGCMQAFVWGTTYPGFADALMPLACLPTAIAGRNRMMRHMAIEAIRQDPAWRGGDYEQQPVQGLRGAAQVLLVMGSSPLQMQKAAPTREQAERYADDYLARAMARTDANDAIYQWEASRNYDPSGALDRIRVPVRFVNSADDYVNPPELGIAEELTKRMPRAKFVLLPIAPETRGHGTHTHAALWKQHLVELLRESERAETPAAAAALESAPR